MNKLKHFISTGEGCECSDCHKIYQVDLVLPDDLWQKIEGGNLMLCPECIGRRMESVSTFSAYHIAAASELSLLNSVGRKLAEMNEERRFSLEIFANLWDLWAMNQFQVLDARFDPIAEQWVQSLAAAPDAD